jgi:hypothetical protein
MLLQAIKNAALARIYGFFGKPGDAGVAFFVVGIVIYLISSAGLAGLLMFEASRLFGFEVRLKDECEPANHSQTQPTGRAV